MLVSDGMGHRYGSVCMTAVVCRVAFEVGKCLEWTLLLLHCPGRIPINVHSSTTTLVL